jgi:hypothetical protein
MTALLTVHKTDVIIPLVYYRKETHEQRPSSAKDTRRTVQKYILSYSIRANVLEILRVLHTARDGGIADSCRLPQLDNYPRLLGVNT